LGEQAVCLLLFVLVEERIADMADKKDSREQQLADARKASDADTKKQLERINSTQPTPTQEENDRAKLGFHSTSELDDKEDDGSPEQKAAAYQTRDTKAAK
jgi:hypothetical protein